MPRVGVAELALDDDQRRAFARHLDGVGVPQLVRRSFKDVIEFQGSGGPPMTARWNLDGKRLRFTDVGGERGDQFVWGRTWIKTSRASAQRDHPERARPGRCSPPRPRLSSPERWVEALARVDAALMVAGRTHQQDDRVVGGVRFVNVGRVGLPYEGDRAARWLWIADGVPELRTPRMTRLFEELAAG